ncbi:MAG: thiamine pyrophosphate-binding protein [Betaproteobacteria bacterium]|nr:thiamine pyrophosphate-binding protein [Betaproteobacteria bacterium]
MAKHRGADSLAHALANAGARQIFSLSGNQIMPVYDAAIDAGLNITHVRHEGAAVHMADAWGRLTGEPGIALLTGGPGHANGIGALYTALVAESPMVMLSGAAPLNQLGRGAFQEMAQADIAAPLTKASFTGKSAATLGDDIARAMRIARSGRPGPVHLSLPFDVLEHTVENGEARVPARDAFYAPPQTLPLETAQAIAAEIARAQRPLILTGPQLAAHRGQVLREQLSQASGAAVVAMESPRGIADPCLGAFGDVLPEADLIVLIGKQPDFTLKFAAPPAVHAQCRFIVIDADIEVLRRSIAAIKRERVLMNVVADAPEAVRGLIQAFEKKPIKSNTYKISIEQALSYRPPAWASAKTQTPNTVHAAEIGRAVQAVLDPADDAILIADGGEFGQWAQACVNASTRVINGPAGSIGSSIPFAMAARVARPNATVIAMLGDGTLGFHLAEFDTAVRHNLAFVAVVGNDSCWNAEYQIQLKSYGKDRTIGCELQPGTAYEQAVAALGGHGERVTRAADLPAALARALKSSKPACVNVMIERLPAPNVSRVGASGGGH